MKSKILFRSDGNSKIGLGHLYRLFALYEMYKDYYDCTFVTRSDSTLSVIPSDYNLGLLPIDISLKDESNWIKDKFVNTDVIIADGYQFNSSYQKSLKDKGFKLIYIDDLAEELMYADIVVNHSPNIRSEDYKACDYTKFALGTKYAILRPGFLEAAKKQRTIKYIDTAFVCFGGSDINNLTFKAIKALTRIKQIKKINAVVGDANQNKDIYEFEKVNAKINIYRNLCEKELISIMQESNFAIVPASTILYEICSVKMPVLSGFYVDNQKSVYSGLMDKKAIWGVGYFPDSSITNFREVIKKVIVLKDHFAQIENQSKLFDDKIRNRYLKLIEKLFLRLRKIKAEDIDLLFEWVNDKRVRASAINKEPIGYEDHKKWFNKVLKSKNTKIYILEINNVPIGQIRFGFKDGVYLMDYSIDVKQRGNGYGYEIIRMGINKLVSKKNNIIFKAVVRKRNFASYKIFKNSNFRVLSINSNFITFVLKI